MIKNDHFKYRKAIAYIESHIHLAKSLHKAKAEGYIHPYIARVQMLLDMLSNPERRLEYIHVAGTAGNGTIFIMLHNIFIASEKRAALFTSHCFITRYKIRNSNLIIYLNRLVFSLCDCFSKNVAYRKQAQNYSNDHINYQVFFHLCIIV